MNQKPVKVAWITFFPVEWLANAPEEIKGARRHHPAPWQRTLASELVKLPGLELHVFALQKSFQRDLTFELDGITYHVIKTIGGSRAPTLFWAETLRLRQELKAIRPDLVHAWGTENGAALVASRLGVPWLVTVQGLMNWMKELMPLSVRERVLVLLENRSLRRARFLTGESVFSSAYIRRICPEADVRHVDLVPDPLFHTVIRQPKRNPKRFLFNAHLGPRKGGDLLLRALHLLAPEIAFELVVIGGAEAELLRKFKSELPGEFWNRISFRQGLSPAQVATELSEATMLLCPTLADTGPLSVKEAVVAGVPVIGSHIGGLPDYVSQGENGLLFTPGDLSSFVDAIRKACADPVLGAGNVSQQVLLKVRSQLAPDLMTQKFAKMYHDIHARAVRG